MNLMSGVKLLEMSKYEIFTCLISFSDQINLCMYAHTNEGEESYWKEMKQKRGEKE